MIKIKYFWKSAQSGSRVSGHFHAFILKNALFIFTGIKSLIAFIILDENYEKVEKLGPNLLSLRRFVRIYKTI